MEKRFAEEQIVRFLQEHEGVKKTATSSRTRYPRTDILPIEVQIRRMDVSEAKGLKQLEKITGQKVTDFHAPQHASRDPNG